MTAGLLWLLAGIAACGAELLVPAGGYLLWLGLAACGGGALTQALGLAPLGQVVAFVALVAALLAVAWLRRRRVDPVMNAPDAAILGRTCRAIAFNGLEGRVRIADGSWSARLAGGTEPQPDALMRVVGRDGTTLLVAPVTL